MSSRLYLGPATADDLKPSERSGVLSTELRLLAAAIQLSRHPERKDRVALLLEGDDGTRRNRRWIAQATQRH